MSCGPTPGKRRRGDESDLITADALLPLLIARGTMIAVGAATAFMVRMA